MDRLKLGAVIKKKQNVLGLGSLHYVKLKKSLKAIICVYYNLKMYN